MLKNFWGFCKRHRCIVGLYFFLPVAFLAGEVQDAASKEQNTPVEESDESPAESDGAQTPANGEAELKTGSDDKSTKTGSEKASGDKAAESAEQPTVEKNFSNLGDGYMLVGDGDSWYYETLNDEGNIAFKYWYDKDKIIKQQSFFYENNLLQKVTELSENKSIVYGYDRNGNITRIEETADGLVTATKKKYNAKNAVIEIETESGDKIRLQKFFYKNDGSLWYEENYTDGVLNAKIEYFDKKKRVHIFLDGKEIKTFDDEN